MRKTIRFIPVLVSVFALSTVATSCFAQPPNADLELWKELDFNPDGWLDGKELEGGWIRFDKDGDGEVTKSEFLNGRKSEMAATDDDVVDEPLSTDDLEKQFENLDATGNGYLTGPELTPELLAKYDSNRDGVVSKEEFKNGGTPNAKKKREISPTRTLTPAKDKSAIAKKDATIAQPVPGRLVNGKPEGLFFMQKYWIATRSLEKSCWYFSPDGTVYENISDGFSPEQLQAHKGSKGKYRFNKKNMIVEWSDGQKSDAEMELSPNSFYWETGSYVPVQPADPKTLAGTYSGGMSSTLSGVSSMIARTMTLSESGAFQLEGASSFKSDSDQSTKLSTGSTSSNRGTWKLDGFVLTLRFDDGTVQSHICFAKDDEGTPVTPDRLYFSGIMYQKQ